VSCQRRHDLGSRALLVERREEILAIAAPHHGRRVRVSGSVACGQAKPDSDIDFLVDAVRRFRWCVAGVGSVLLVPELLTKPLRDDATGNSGSWAGC